MSTYTSEAIFSPDRVYRYDLRRYWANGSGYAMFIGLNPSTADETQDDPTVRRCIRFAQDWGFGGLCMANIFAFRATQPEDMKSAPDPIGPENNFYLVQSALGAGVVVAAWGVHGTYLNRCDWVRKLLPNLHYLRLTKDGHPGHPLYLPANLKPERWDS